MSLILGIDEVGRGPIIGPMVLCGYLIEEYNIPQLISLGVRDSKELTPKNRCKLYNKLIELSKDIVIKKIEPEILDKFNLNTIEKNITIEIINQLSPDVVYIDVPVRGKYIDRYLEPIIKNIKPKAKIIGKNKADKLYPVVGAASIIAKVVRDNDLIQLNKMYGDIGSGYPSDNRTIDFLKNFYKFNKCFPPFVRKSWKCINKLINIPIWENE